MFCCFRPTVKALPSESLDKINSDNLGLKATTGDKPGGSIGPHRTLHTQPATKPPATYNSAYAADGARQDGARAGTAGHDHGPTAKLDGELLLTDALVAPSALDAGSVWMHLVKNVRKHSSADPATTGLKPAFADLSRGYGKCLVAFAF